MSRNNRSEEWVLFSRIRVHMESPMDSSWGTLASTCRRATQWTRAGARLLYSTLCVSILHFKWRIRGLLFCCWTWTLLQYLNGLVTGSADLNCHRMQQLTHTLPHTRSWKNTKLFWCLHFLLPGSSQSLTINFYLFFFNFHPPYHWVREMKLIRNSYIEFGSSI